MNENYFFIFEKVKIMKKYELLQSCLPAKKSNILQILPLISYFRSIFLFQRNDVQKNFAKYRTHFLPVHLPQKIHMIFQCTHCP